MRVPNINNYQTSTYRLGYLTEGLRDANEVASSQKKINELSDDPLGLSQVLSLKDSIGNLNQIDRNVKMGKSWLISGEKAMESANNLILEAQKEAERLANDSITDDERSDAVDRINSIIEQIVSLGNTQVNGNYIFGGTRTNVKPFEFDQSFHPGRVIYNGNNNPFTIRTDRNAGVPVGKDGHQTFWDKKIQINSTNNTISFTEDNGHGFASQKRLKAIIPDGIYTRASLETAARNALNKASQEEGYGAGYEVSYNADNDSFSIRDNGTYQKYLKTEFTWETGTQAYVSKINVSGSLDPEDIDLYFNEKALTLPTPEPHGTKPFRLIWQGNDTWQVANNPGYIISPSRIKGTANSVEIDLTESGHPDITLKMNAPMGKPGDYIEFEITKNSFDTNAGHEIGFTHANTIQEPPVSDHQAEHVTDLVFVDGTNDEITFTEINSTGGTRTLSIDLNTMGTDRTFTDMNELAREIETLMEAASAAGANPNNIDYNVTYDPESSKFSIRENGSSLDEFQLNWKQSNATEQTAKTLGFHPVTDKTIYPASDTNLDRTIVINENNQKIVFEEWIAPATSGTSITATVAPGVYRNAADFAIAVETAMDTASTSSADYSVTYNPVTRQFTVAETTGTISEFRIPFDKNEPEGGTIAKALGFDPGIHYQNNLSYTSSREPVVMSFGPENSWVDFTETDKNNNSTKAGFQIPEGDYTSMDQVASAIEKGMRENSFFKVDYHVSYDRVENEFIIKEGGHADIASFTMNWQSGDHTNFSAAEHLGFATTHDHTAKISYSDESVVNITIDDNNNKLDFTEVTTAERGMKSSELTAFIEKKTYTSHEQLAEEVEKAMEAASLKNGERIDYTVSWDEHTKKFAIKENGMKLDKLHLQWQSGKNGPPELGGTGQSIGDVLGFESDADDVETPEQANEKADWGIFKTLLNFKEYLSANDRDGIERSIGRLHANRDQMTSRIADSGMKYSRLLVRESITKEVSLGMTERKSNIEEADIIQSIMKLKSMSTAYEAALAATTKILKVTLIDYM